MQIAVTDIDGDGDLDFATGGKSGLFLFENLTQATQVMKTGECMAHMEECGPPGRSRREFFGATAAAVVAGGHAISAKPERRPNVVFVLTDQWRAQATGYAGDTNVRTPALDRLAGESVNFHNAVSGLPVCCPYRASLITGQYPRTNGVFINDVPLAPKGPTLGAVFSGAGYRTGFIGKWHLYGSPGGKNERRRSPIPREKRFAFDYWKVSECSHIYNHSAYYEGDDPTVRYWEGYDAIAQTADACEFIERHAKSAAPFFLTVSLGPPHSPYDTAPDRYKALYEQQPLEYRRNVPQEHRQAAAAIMRGYYSHIAALDDCVARFLSTIEKSGIAEDTIFVFTSDHGGHAGFARAPRQTSPLGRIDRRAISLAVSPQAWEGEA